MSRFCSNCGNEVEEGTNFCTKCGASLNGNNGNRNDNKTVIINNYSNNNNSVNLPERSIALAIVLSIITCGIYAIYWFIVITDEANAVSDEQGTSGGVAFLLNLVTCGIYGIYWSYRMGQKLYSAGQKYNKPIGDNAVLYLVLSIFGLGIINYCLIQNDLNRFAK